jgi:3-deoxy-D-manno-octulosonic-acid transferase
LGETRALAPLLAQWRAQWPGLRLLLTHGTATGREAGAALLRAGDLQVWQPWDTPGATARFVRHFRPRWGVLLETEVWPNLVQACYAAQTPLYLVSVSNGGNSSIATYCGSSTLPDSICSFTFSSLLAMIKSGCSEMIFSRFKFFVPPTIVFVWQISLG